MRAGQTKALKTIIKNSLELKSRGGFCQKLSAKGGTLDPFISVSLFKWVPFDVRVYFWHDVEWTDGACDDSLQQFESMMQQNIWFVWSQTRATKIQHKLQNVENIQSLRWSRLWCCVVQIKTRTFDSFDWICACELIQMICLEESRGRDFVFILSSFLEDYRHTTNHCYRFCAMMLLN